MNSSLPNAEARVARLTAAMELMAFGIELMHHNIKRQLPHASPEYVEAELSRWLFEQPAVFAPRPEPAKR